MFKEHKRLRNVDEDSQLLKPYAYQGPPTQKELDKHQSTIDKLVIKRYTDDDNSFLRIAKMDNFEIHKVYKDNYPLFNIRMKMWHFYM